MTEIIPAIMPQSLGHLRDILSLIVPYVSQVQLDIMDGHFVKSKTWPYFQNKSSFQALLAEQEGLPYWEKVDFEMDLMISKPEDSIDDWITAGANRIIVHIESTKNMQDIVKQMNARFVYPEPGQKKDVELGIALNIDTPTDSILEYLEDIDFVQFMGIQTIGLQGEPFDERVIDKIRDFHNAHPEVILSTDGGVKLDSAPHLIEAGVKRLVVGSALLESKDVRATLNTFKDISL